MKSATLRMRKWREKNRDRSRETDRRWRKNNPEAYAAKYMRWLDKNRETEAARSKADYPAYYAANKETIKSKRRLSHHGATQEWYDTKMAEQDNRCALCNRLFTKTPHIDHDHRCCKSHKSCSKCKRGILCTDCNLGLGRFKDDIATFERAIQYIMRYNYGLVNKPRV